MVFVLCKDAPDYLIEGCSTTSHTIEIIFYCFEQVNSLIDEEQRFVAKLLTSITHYKNVERMFGRSTGSFKLGISLRNC